MIETKEVKHKKAYVELYKMLLNLPKTDFEKIPENIINNIKLSGDNSYNWEYDDSKNFENQDISVETKALFIQVYRHYLMDPSEKEKWEKYDIICKNKIEEEKAKKYDPSKIFENSKVENKEIIAETNTTAESAKNQELMVIEEESFIQKISKMFKDIINKIFKRK